VEARAAMGDIMGKISAWDKYTLQKLRSFETGTRFARNPMTERTQSNIAMTAVGLCLA
jgi:hypothetical protein